MKTNIVKKANLHNSEGHEEKGQFCSYFRWIYSIGVKNKELQFGSKIFHQVNYG